MAKCSTTFYLASVRVRPVLSHWHWASPLRPGQNGRKTNSSTHKHVNTYGNKENTFTYNTLHHTLHYSSIRYLPDQTSAYWLSVTCLLGKQRHGPPTSTNLPLRHGLPTCGSSPDQTPVLSTCLMIQPVRLSITCCRPQSSNPLPCHGLSKCDLAYCIFITVHQVPIVTWCDLMWHAVALVWL